jgi:Tfp pilus assembly protein PilF
MSSPPSERASSPDRPLQSAIKRYGAPFLTAIALIYALLAGLHTLQDFDLGWQLATGRWILHHHQLFSTDVFSYTAQGSPWIYPALSSIAFYLTYLAGGYALLSWLGAAACTTTIALLITSERSIPSRFSGGASRPLIDASSGSASRPLGGAALQRCDNYPALERGFSRRGTASIALALIAIPLIANRTQPRAEMFTVILFAAFLNLLWRHYRTARSPLWLLPILMAAWVNLHPGFIAGLALCGAYILLELLDLPFAQTRPRARARLKQAWPYLALTAAATLVNPWGAKIYSVLSRQAQAQNLHNLWVVEWESIHPSWSSLRQALDWRDPQSSFWWLLGLAVVCAAVALWRKHFGAALILLASAYLTIQHVRLQALFACVVVILGGSLLTEAWQYFRSKPQSIVSIRSVSKRQPRIEWTIAALFLTAALTLLASIRSYDLITNRYYLRSSHLSLFGTGLSWWFPERAVDFIRREKLPANIFNTYSLGGYLTWRLSPDYLDYIDSRAIPFGPQLFFRAYDLSTQPPDSPTWQQEADDRNINTIIVSLARYDGITLFPQLPAFCRSQTWRPVYMDEVSAIFLRRTPETNSEIDRLEIDCDKVSLAPPRDLEAAKTSREKAELFNSFANAAGILYSLSRYGEALAYLDRAQNIFSDNANLHLTRALVLEYTGHATEAEEEFRASIRIEPLDESWLDLGLFYLTEKRYADAIEIFRRSAETSSRPHDLWMLLGQSYLQMHQPDQALVAFDKAEGSSPFRDEGESLGANFNSMIATGRAKAWYQLGDTARAVSFQEDAVKLAPNDAKLWLGLADLYEAEGRTTLAEQAKRRAAGR